ncbi:MAG: hypothetical protein JNN00_12470 [Chitinophagaceae bacterium]|nr:hypothetical protein [Chitinophagaceae bacterium]
MKTLKTILYGTALSAFLFVSCQRDSIMETVKLKNNNSAASDGQIILNAKQNPPQGVCNPNAYVITLESRSFTNGYWEWTWSVYNSNPGNGNNGTVQNLSHWGMQLGSCVNFSSVVSGAYSSDGSNWTSFTPSYQPDPSQGCMTAPVIKFDFGTTGNTKSYYRLIVNQDFTEGTVPGYYKSGSNTGCCTFTLTGIGGCGGPVEIVE